ncbi:MAG: flagellar hook capping protein [Lachnospiraceae bacterium]|nr:flagellar hook capping protein [Lachnospiraceae bacterium]
MSLIAPIEDGKVVESASQSSLNKTKEAGNDMDKDAFLQLLVAQMKYQDPLQPTSNTEYISQYAQFSQVEQMQNMAASVELQRASQLVGENVYVKTTTSSGETKYIQGKVDYVVYENNKAYLSINESLYALDDLDTVHDPLYLEAYEMATGFVEALNQLPNINVLDMSDAAKIDKLNETYNSMNEYQQSFVATEKVDMLKLYTDKITALRKEQEAEQNKENADGAGNEE